MSNPPVASPLPSNAVHSVSLAVIEEVAPEELPIAQYFIDPLIEMAEGGELPYIDPRDPGGGFGSSDPLFVTVIPVVVDLVRARREGKQLDVLWRNLGSEIDRIAKAVGSQQAQQRVDVLQAAIRRAFEELGSR